MLTRLKEPKLQLSSEDAGHDGENLKDTDPRAKSFQEYRDYAGVDEGMSGIDALRVQDPVQGLQLRRPRSPPTRCT